MVNFINRIILLFTEKDCYGNKIDGNKVLYNNNESNYSFDGNKHYEIIKKVRNRIYKNIKSKRVNRNNRNT